MNVFKPFRLLFAFGTSILFIALGCYLIQKDEKLPQIIGYTNIIFWSVLWLAVCVKIVSNLFKKKES